MCSSRHSEKFCMICLDSSEECKLYPVNKCNLDLEYQHLTGISLQDELHFEPQFCTECAQGLSNCSKFRNKSLRAYHLLLGLIEKHGMISMEIIKTIDRTGNKLASNIAKKLYPPNHYDFHLTEIKDNHNAQENKLNIKEIKCEFELLDNDIYDDVNNISEDANDEHNIHAVKNFKNEMDSTDCDIDIDIDDDDDTNYINHDMGTLASKPHIKKERKSNKPQLTIKNKTYVNTVKDSKVPIRVKNTANAFKNYMDCDIDIDIDDHYDTDYIKCDMETLASEQHIKKEIKSNNTQLTVNNDNERKTNLRKRKVLVKESEKQIHPRKLIRVKKEPVKKIINEGTQRKITRKKTRHSNRKKFVSSRKLNLKLFQEIALTQEQQKAEFMKRKESDSYKCSLFKCTMCYSGFRRSETYNAHIVKHTDKFGLIECEMCRIRYKSERFKKKHFSYNHRFIYKCTECLYVCNNRNSAILHQRWHDGKIYKCTHCDQEFTKYSSRMSHLRIKHPSDSVCALCGFSFIGEKGLQSHMDRAHRFDETQDLAGPLCEPCNIRFASEEAYLQHMQVSPKHASVGQLKTNCPYQGKMPKGDDVSIDCEQCGMKLQGARKYAMHFRKEHPDKTRAQRPLARCKLAAKVMCDQCGKVFLSPSFLRQHMQVHTGVKLYKCEICHKGFTTALSRRLHVNGHTAKASFPCHVCHKTFTYESNQKRHMLSHQATRPLHKCDICDKTFTGRIGRDQHVSHVHMNVPRPKRNRRDRQPDT
ncbi:zinc finger protein 846-like isoform X2 [Maniola hyperantus]|uniref:zinc finger protein 846-like isoform X2 n=1 Tax=Aphantopus hyperantus TaxID=2795564 RepID=UPI002128D658